MTDRELLELAAKAAGIALSHWNDGLEPYSSGEGYVLLDNRLWNPLLYDGNALRLLVLLGIEIRHVNGAAHAGRADHFWCTECWFPDGDKSKATRRAITRAAAELAKQEVKP